MTNYNKSFSFRNGVQVDDSNFVVNTVGLVGIGTSIPTEVLDVRGSAKVSGIVTTKNLFSSGIATFTEVRLGTNIKMSDNTGIITATSYYGDGSTLSNLPTSQWVDVDVGLGFTSIYAQGYVGIATNDPRYVLQVGGKVNLGQNGVGINSNGNIVASGVITASSFVGQGPYITAINADNITAGTLSNDRLPIINNDRLPSNISISGIITAATGSFTNLNVVSIAATGDVRITGIVTSLGGFVGNVTGIASTAIVAQGLTGSPDISVGIVSATSLRGSTLSVGTAGTALGVLSSGNVGIGTSIPTSDVQIRKRTPIVEIISTFGQSRLSIGQSAVGAGNSSALIRFGNTSKTFDILNNDTGSFNSYLHAGAAGINTGRFGWIYGQSSEELLSLTYQGSLGLGITNPSNTLHVVGTSTVTSNSYVGGNVEILGSFSLGSGSNKSVINPTTNSVLNKVNLNVTSGVSTVANVLVSSGSSIGIATNRAIVGFDARGQIGLIDTLGIGTISTSNIGGISLYNQGTSSLVDTVGIGTTAILDDADYGSGKLQVFGGIRVESDGDLTMRNYGLIGINSLSPIGAIDARYASLTAAYRATFYPPILTITERNTITSAALVGSGAIIYNSTTGNHQAYDGSSWAPAGLTGTQNISVGIITATKLVIGTSGTTITTNNNRVGIGTTNPQGILDLVSTTSPFYLPRMTTAQRDAISGISSGAMIFNTAVKEFQAYTGTAWVTIGL
jgi:hypothetical protein